MLKDMDQFVDIAYSLLLDHLDWATDLNEWINNSDMSEAEKAYISPYIKRIRTLYDTKKSIIKNPTYAKTLSRELYELSGTQEQDKLSRVNSLGRKIRSLGGNQDNILSLQRFAIMDLRQIAGYRYSTANNANDKNAYKHIWESSQAILRLKFNVTGK